jgi:hypothetical protein
LTVLTVLTVLTNSQRLLVYIEKMVLKLWVVATEGTMATKGTEGTVDQQVMGTENY